MLRSDFNVVFDIVFRFQCRFRCYVQISLPFSLSFHYRVDVVLNVIFGVTSSGQRARAARADHLRARRLPRLCQAAPRRVRPHHIVRDGESKTDTPISVSVGEVNAST